MENDKGHEQLPDQVLLYKLVVEVNQTLDASKLEVRELICVCKCIKEFIFMGIVVMIYACDV